ncbi:NACHT domain-containing protein [Streptomyces sp. NPDC092903]|uniref:NACHT domain-containing protein n=1 Tax=Streptomyces sp. NPDC092903 TaxID=3366017 RepID=UPI0038138C85
MSRTTSHSHLTSKEAEFEDRYRAYLTQRHGELTIFGMVFGDRRHARWPLNPSYVSLEVTDAAPGSVGWVERVEQGLAGRQRTVVMGDAGSGNTTLLQWLAISAARRSLPSLLEHLNGNVPVVLPLRSLASRSSFPRPEDLLAAVGCPWPVRSPRDGLVACSSMDVRWCWWTASTRSRRSNAPWHSGDWRKRWRSIPAAAAW